MMILVFLPFFPDGRNKISVEKDLQVLPYCILNGVSTVVIWNFCRRLISFTYFCSGVSASAMVN